MMRFDPLRNALHASALARALENQLWAAMVVEATKPETPYRKVTNK